MKRMLIRPAPIARRAPLVLSVVDTRNGLLHRVAVETAARYRNSGCYPALCGVDVPAASLTTPAAQHCRDCAARIRQGSAPNPEARRVLRPWLRRPRPASRMATR